MTRIYNFSVTPSSKRTYYGVTENDINDWLQSSSAKSHDIRQAIAFYIKYRSLASDQQLQDRLDTILRVDSILEAIQDLRHDIAMIGNVGTPISDGSFADKQLAAMEAFE